MITVRDAGAPDREAIIEMLARAFSDDPAAAWLQPRRDKRISRSRTDFSTLFDSLDAGWRLTTAGHEAACLWQWSCEADRFAKVPTKAPSDVEELSAGRARLMMAELEARKPPGDFWHLLLAGCEPELQGRGYGAAVVRAGLQRSEGQRAYLETANPRNLPFYRALGFAVLEEWEIAEGGPHYWSMLYRAS